MEKYKQILKSLINAVELRDPYTKGHSQRVAVYAREFGKFLNLDETEIEKLYISGLLHDIGKVVIPDNILLKPSFLTAKEYSIVKYYPVLSAEIVAEMEDFKELSEIVKYHRENFDGSGYPEKLSGKNIPFLSRILSIADVFDALSTDKIYRKAFTLEESVRMMEDMKYKFDGALLMKFFNFIKNFGLLESEGFLKESVSNEVMRLRETVLFEDMITGLFNKNAFFLLIRKAISLKQSISVVSFDIVNYKLIKQKMGVVSLDKIVKLTAGEIKNHLGVKLNLDKTEENDVFAIRNSGARFLLLVIGKSEIVFEKLDIIEKKVSNIFKEVEFKKSVLIENMQMDYNFEKVIEYII